MSINVIVALQSLPLAMDWPLSGQVCEQSQCEINMKVGPRMSSYTLCIPHVRTFSMWVEQIYMFDSSITSLFIISQIITGFPTKA